MSSRDRQSRECHRRDNHARSRDRHRSSSQARPPRHRRSRSRSPYHPEDKNSDERGRRRQDSGRHRYRSPPAQSPKRGSKSTSRFSALEGPVVGEHGTSLAAPIEKQRPNFGVSGKLAAETNAVKGTDIVLKYNEPPEARKPPNSQAWRIYVFKDNETVDTIDLYTRSCWLFGRERVVADYHLQHPSTSKQHAVIQFRHTEKRNEFGDRIATIKPYLMDLESANGTCVNKADIPASRYYELRSGDVVTFGDSSREYVVMLPPKD